LKHFTDERANNDSKGAGAIMRVAPVALIVNHEGEEDAHRVFQLAKAVSWITHGHPSGYLSATAFAVVLHSVLWGQSLLIGIERSHKFLEREDESAETRNAIVRAMTCVDAHKPPELAIPLLGGAWVGEEALAVALYCAFSTSDFTSAVRMAVNHDGDSDTTGSLAGQLAGAPVGEEVIPILWLHRPEIREAIAEVASDLADFFHWDLDQSESGEFKNRIWQRYSGW
jgi:ADP-ribosylglycohydrolase